MCPKNQYSRKKSNTRKQRTKWKTTELLSLQQLLKTIENIDGVCICMMFDWVLVSSYKKSIKKIPKKVSSVPSEENN